MRQALRAWRRVDAGNLTGSPRCHSPQPAAAAASRGPSSGSRRAPCGAPKASSRAARSGKASAEVSSPRKALKQRVTSPVGVLTAFRDDVYKRLAAPSHLPCGSKVTQACCA